MIWIWVYVTIMVACLVLRWWFNADFPASDADEHVAAIVVWPLTAVCLVVWFFASLCNEFRDAIRARRQRPRAGGGT